MSIYDVLITVGLTFTCGSIVGWLLTYFGSRKNVEAVTAELRRQIEQSGSTICDLQKALESALQAKIKAETRLEEAAKNIEEQKRLFDKAQEKLAVSFQALSGESLKSNNEAFLNLANEKLGKVLSDAKGIVSPLEDMLRRYEGQIKDIENARIDSYTKLNSQITCLLSSEQQLQKETSALSNALRKPEMRGRWGELTLRRVVELAGMMEHCDYSEQVSTEMEDGRLRPDMVIHLPAEREVVVDSKVPLDAYRDAVNAETEEAKKELLERHAQQVRKHMKSLASKNYWEKFPKSPEFVVMFIPAESFLSVAVDKDPALIEDGMKDRIVIATPTTLMALLMAVAYGWKQESIAQSALLIADLGKEIYERCRPFLDHVVDMGKNLTSAVSEYNEMVGSLERRVLVSVRKLKEYGVANNEIPDVKQIDQTLRNPDFNNEENT